MTAVVGNGLRESVVIGLDEDHGRAVLDWVIDRAAVRDLRICLVTAVAVDASNPASAKEALASASRRIQLAAPDTPVESVVTDRPLLHELLDRSASCDLLAIGSHPDPAMRDVRTPSFPVSLSARSRCAVVIVPDDWEARGGPVVVGIDATDMSLATAVFAAREAIAVGRPLDIVHTWEPWASPKTRSELFAHEATLNAVVDRIRTDFPTLRVRGVLREAVAHDGVIASSRDACLVVLGTHGLGLVTGLVLGAIHQEVMISGRVALCIVPLAQKTSVTAGDASGAGMFATRSEVG